MKQSLSNRSRQQGALLIITMIMLVIVTMVTLTVVRTATVEERMAGNSRDRDKALQAAEAAMRLCLNRLADETYKGASPTVQTPAAANSKQVWDPTSTNWKDDSIAGKISDDAAGIKLSDFGLVESPRCIYEQLGTSTGSYRVTVRALGARDTTAVILQATYTNE